MNTPRSHSIQLDRVRHAPLPPKPRTPVRDSLRRLAQRPAVLPGLTYSDLRQLFASVPELTEVAVWTACGGDWQEHASFLLGTGDGRWQVIRFSEPATTRLVAQLRSLPDFDTDLLLDLIGQRTRQVTTIWRRPEYRRC
jgi:hypothetical protein